MSFLLNGIEFNLNELYETLSWDIQTLYVASSTTELQPCITITPTTYETIVKFKHFIRVIYI